MYLCWLLDIFVRRTRPVFRTDVPRSQHNASSMKIAILAPNSQGDRFLSQSSALVPDCLSATPTGYATSERKGRERPEKLAKTAELCLHETKPTVFYSLSRRDARP